MPIFRPAVAFILIFLSSTSIVAQNEVDLTAAVPSEDQFIAEAIWSLVDFGLGNPIDSQTAFDDATKAYPQSAKAAYWRGRFGSYASNRTQVFDRLSETLKTLSEPLPESSEIADPSVQQRMRSARLYAKKISKRIEQRANSLPAGNEIEPFEVSLLNAIAFDPSLIAAWAALLESDDPIIALSAADGWATQEPDNALPLYAKAVVLTRDSKRDDPIGVAAIEALELGSRRPDCRVPDEPWPIRFSLTFPDPMPSDAADLAGKAVTPQMLRKVVESMFSQVDAIGGGAVISESAIRELGSLVLRQSHRLPIEDDVRYLRAFAGVGVHMVQSNRVLYGVTAASADKVFNRLETIAIAHRDFDHADELARIREYVLTTRRKVADGYRAAEFGEDPARIDIDATRIMQASKEAVTIPPIAISDQPESKFVVSDSNAMESEADMVLLDLFYSSDNRVFVRGPGQRLPTEEAASGELSNRGYVTLRHAIDDLRESNRKHRRSRGIFMVANNKYMVRAIANECFASGYLGRSDPCIIAFTHRESLDDFRESYPHLGVRLAQILEPDFDLNSDKTRKISGSADFVVVPLERLVQDDGQVKASVRSSNLQFIVSVAQPNWQDQIKGIEEVGSIVGTITINLPTHAEESAEP